jgi:hypothetical protein
MLKHDECNDNSVVTPLLSTDTRKDMEGQFAQLQSSEQDEDLKTRVLENYKILLFTAISFLLFVIAEIVGALVSGSLSLLGDAGAMSVDVFTVSHYKTTSLSNYLT